MKYYIGGGLLILLLCGAGYFAFTDFHARQKISNYKKNRPYLLAAAKEFNIEPALVLGLAKIESSFNENAVSSAGAIGLLQLMPGTFKEQAKKLKLTAPDARHPETNARVGIAYLKYLLGNYNDDLHFALAAYNAGPGNLSKARKGKEKLSGEEFLNKLPKKYQYMKAYVSKVLKARNSFLEH